MALYDYATPSREKKSEYLEVFVGLFVQMESKLR
jgi:hypothetical protein